MPHPGSVEMSMKINPSIDRVAADKGLAPAPSDRKAASGAGASGSGDSIKLSPLSAQLQALEAKLATGNEFDRTKVEAIKQAIREGRLQVNPDVIAERMVAHALAMLGKDR